jgi:hypothetical protein
MFLMTFGWFSLGCWSWCWSPPPIRSTTRPSSIKLLNPPQTAFFTHHHRAFILLQQTKPSSSRALFPPVICEAFLRIAAPRPLFLLAAASPDTLQQALLLQGSISLPFYPLPLLLTISSLSAFFTLLLGSLLVFGSTALPSYE